MSERRLLNRPNDFVICESHIHCMEKTNIINS